MRRYTSIQLAEALALSVNTVNRAMVGLDPVTARGNTRYWSQEQAEQAARAFGRPLK